MFWKNFYNLCSIHGKSPNSVAKELGISSGAVTAWKSGRVPHHNTLLKISNYFAVTVDFLLCHGEEEKPTANDGELSDNRKKLMEFANSVPEDKVDLLLRVMQSIVEADQ